MDRPHRFCPSSVDGHLGGLHLLVIVDGAAMNICVQEFAGTPVFSSFGRIPRSEIAASYEFHLNEVKSFLWLEGGKSGSRMFSGRVMTEGADDSFMVAVMRGLRCW